MTAAVASFPSPPIAGRAPTVAWSDLASHRSYLVRFAQRRLRDAALAEDAVHDVFEAVLSGRAAFAGRSALRSWLTAVLKHKIVDALRRQGRHQAIDADDEDDGAAAIASPQPGPDEIAEQRQRLARTLARIDALPDGLRDVVRLRVLDERPTEEVCSALGISTENLFVRLHRARKQLAS
jgi:RNA polymerase sigma-70 factor (ECF subfamily)